MTRTFLLSLAFGFILPDSVTSQDIEWKIPNRGVLLYGRRLDAKPAYMMQGDQFLPGFAVQNPAVLFQGELDPTQRFILADPASLWEIAMHLAFDMRTADGVHEIDQTIPFVTDFGSVRIVGTTGSVAEDGTQSIDVELASMTLPEDGYHEDVLVFLRQQNNKDLRATLRIKRRIDKAEGRIASFESRLEGTAGAQAMSLGEWWEFDRSRLCRDSEFANDVEAVIAKGANYIKEQIRDLSRDEIAAGVDPEGKTVSSGLLALCLLTLIKADIPSTDPVVAAGFEDLRQRRLTDTYSLSLALMAMEALYAPKRERQRLLAGELDQPELRQVSDADRAIMREWVDRLLRNTDSLIEQISYERRFNYLASEPRYDNSNSQFAILGLYSAHLCGVRISKTVWHAMSKHWLTEQFEDGESLPVETKSHAEYKAMRERELRGGRATTSRPRKHQPAGWPYMADRSGSTVRPHMPLTSSMTAAGITALTICEVVLSSTWDVTEDDQKPRPARPMRPDRQTRPVIRDIVAARDQGYAWLLDNFSMRGNRHRLGYGFHMYFLYGIERAFELGRVALIGGRDWYFEGATLLMGTQQSDGSLGMTRPYSTCFGVLFLKMAAPPVPVITGRRR